MGISDDRGVYSKVVLSPKPSKVELEEDGYEIVVGKTKVVVWFDIQTGTFEGFAKGIH
ncbi:hypothetical protein SOVF_058650 [Spinacia oleracea]|nr:hypothetical protein SOVF_058650 [Spinacia oleracea]